MIFRLLMYSRRCFLTTPHIFFVVYYQLLRVVRILPCSCRLCWSKLHTMLATGSFRIVQLKRNLVLVKPFPALLPKQWLCNAYSMWIWVVPQPPLFITTLGLLRGLGSTICLLCVFSPQHMGRNQPAQLATLAVFRVPSLTRPLSKCETDIQVEIHFDLQFSLL